MVDLGARAKVPFHLVFGMSFEQEQDSLLYVPLHPWLLFVVYSPCFEGFGEKLSRTGRTIYFKTSSPSKGLSIPPR